MENHLSLYSQRIYQEHPTYNWTLQEGLSDQSLGNSVYSVAVGNVPVEYLDQSVPEGSGIVCYESTNASNSDPWDRDRIPMVVGSNGTTIVDQSGNLQFEANRFLGVAGRYDTFSFEFWMRISGHPESETHHILRSNYNESYGLYLRGTVLVFVYGLTHCSYDLGVVDEPVFISLQTSSNGIGMAVNGEQVSFAEIFDTDKNHSNLEQTEVNEFDVKFVAPAPNISFPTPLFEVDGVSVFSYIPESDLGKRKYVWGQGAGDVQLKNSNFDGESAFSSFNASEFPNQVAYPLNYKWESGEKDNLVVWSNKLSFRYPKLPVHSFDNSDVVSKTTLLRDWFLNCDENGFSYGSSVSSSPQTTVFENVGDFVSNPVALFVEGSGYVLEISSAFFPGYVVKISGTNVSYKLNSTEEFSILDGVSASSNFLMVFDEFAFSDNYDLWRMFQQPEGLQLSFSYADGGSAKIKGVGFVSQVAKKLYGSSSYTFIQKWEDSTELEPTYFWTYSGHKPLNDSTTLNFNYFYQDVALRGYWEDYVPLSVISDIDESSGDFALDYLQFNMSHLSEGVKFSYNIDKKFGSYPSWDSDYDSNSQDDHTVISVDESDGDGLIQMFLQFETEGFFTYPYQLNKMSLTTFFGDLIKTKGLDIEKKSDDFVYDTESFPFLTLGKNTGFYCDQGGFDVLVGDVGDVGAVQFFVKLKDSSPDNKILAAFYDVQVSVQDNKFSCSGDSDNHLIVNGYEYDDRTLSAGWYCVGVAFNSPKSTDASSVIAMSDGYSFENIGYFLYKEDFSGDDQSGGGNDQSGDESGGDSPGLMIALYEELRVAAASSEDFNEYDTTTDLDIEYGQDRLNFYMLYSPTVYDHEYSNEEMKNVLVDVWLSYTMSEALHFASWQPFELIQNDIAAYPGISWQQMDIQPE